MQRAWNVWRFNGDATITTKANHCLPAIITEEQFSNEELAIALLNPSLRYDPQTLRLGAAMLGAEENDPEKIARLAKHERCESVVRYVAKAGRRFEPNNARHSHCFW